MTDPELWRRREVISLMSRVCECVAHAAVRRVTGDSAQIDVLCRPRELPLSAYTLAVEVKAHNLVGDRELGPWLKQASDYVGGLTSNGWPPIAAAFVWLVGVQTRSEPDEQCRMAGMFQLAQHYRVGKAHEVSGGLRLVFGPSAEIYSDKRGGWTPKAAELLGAKRVSGGVRKALMRGQS